LATAFTRFPAGLLPTQIALELAAHVEALSSPAQSFTLAASTEAGSAAGAVRITASEVCCRSPPSYLAKLRPHPNLIIELGLNNRSENLLDREADIAVGMVRPQQDALVATRIRLRKMTPSPHQPVTPLSARSAGTWPCVTPRRDHP
jgi:DNA-binding transcriptional LysR family regulator